MTEYLAYIAATGEFFLKLPAAQFGSGRQQLEKSWRGYGFLTRRTPAESTCRIYASHP
jgi:hypothetical protein